MVRICGAPYHFYEFTLTLVSTLFRDMETNVIELA